MNNDDSPGGVNRWRAETADAALAVYTLAQHADRRWDQLSLEERSEIRRDLLTDLAHHADGDDGDASYEAELARERYEDDVVDERAAIDNGAQHKCRTCNHQVDESRFWWQRCTRCAEQVPPRPRSYTVTLAGPERHDGEAPTTYVLQAADQDAAIAEAIRIHSTDGGDEPADLEVDHDGTYPGGVRVSWWFNDRRGL